MESNPDAGLLSVKAPVAAALLGKKEGEDFEVVLPRAQRKYRLVKLEYK
jgi:transcription elongation factor GreA